MRSLDVRRACGLLCSSLFFLTTAAGCVDDAASGDGADVGDTDDGGDGDGDGDGASGDGGDGDGDGDGDDGMADEPVPATGIAISRIFANQGVRVQVTEGDEWIGAEPVAGITRSTVLPANRRTLMRIMVETAPDFVPREIAARITIGYADGEELQDVMVQEISGSSADDALNSSINIPLPGEFVRRDMTFQVELFEADPSNADLNEPFGPTVSPAEPAFLGIEGTQRFISATIVPFFHNIGPECRAAPTITEKGQIAAANYLKAFNPVENVYIHVREPIEYTGSMQSFSTVLSFLADLREQDGAAPGEYYYGALVPCDGGAEGVGGQAISIPGFPTMDNGAFRTSVGRWSSSGTDENMVPTAGTLETFVHEVGHTQGRRHSPGCGAGGPDPSYPIAEGFIGSYGFNAVKNEYFGPEDSFDYMTYCNPTHVAGWVWNKVLPYVTEISSWGAPDGDPDAKIVPEGDRAGRLLIGIQDEDGTTSWSVVTGALTDEELSTDASARLKLVDDEVDMPVMVSPLGEGLGTTVAIPLPEGMRGVEALEQVAYAPGSDSPGFAFTVEGGEIRRQLDAHAEMIRRSQTLSAGE